MDLTQKIGDLDYAKAAVRAMVDNPNVRVDFHSLTYWAARVEALREEIKAAL